MELLAPAGSMEAFHAVIAAGADAVYLGGNRFGARAYADNFTENELLAAIDEAHVHGRKVYLTINTLFKEEELAELCDWLTPYYRQGLDAVIVQDIGALALIRREFPDLPIHASTQMTVTGGLGAKFLKSLGVKRVVAARELSLEELRHMRDVAGDELECFVHGALCYCYSGQCLMSSMLGGRSGNRGRCAQPCRLPYELLDADKNPVSAARGFLLSPKDLCAIEAIPALYEAGVYSLKIEGRMKSAEYAAGVTAVYRKYLDSYFEKLSEYEKNYSEGEALNMAREAYHVDDADLGRLAALGNRDGFTDGYFHRRNGREMISLVSSNHAASDEAVWEEVRERYMRRGAKREITGRLTLKAGLPAEMEASCGGISVCLRGDVVQCAANRPLSTERVLEQVNKTGGTPFRFASVELDMDEGIFLPVQAQNSLRRDTLAALEQEMASACHRDGAGEGHLPRNIGDSPKYATQNTSEKLNGDLIYTATSENISMAGHASNANIAGHASIAGMEGVTGRTKNPALIVSVETDGQLAAALSCDRVDAVYIDSIFINSNNENFHDVVRQIHAHGKQAFFILPAVVRPGTRKRLAAHMPVHDENTKAQAAVPEYDETLEFDGVIDPALPGFDGMSDVSLVGLDEKLSLALAGFDGLVAGSLDAVELARENFPDMPLVADHRLYTYNHLAQDVLAQEEPRGAASNSADAGIRPSDAVERHQGMKGSGSCLLRDTAPLELNRRELRKRDNGASELVVYGRMPLMTSAQCLRHNFAGGCGRQSGELFYIKDRYGKYFPVKNNCAACYSVIYNADTLCLSPFADEIREMGFAAYRLSFTTESEGEARRVIDTYAKIFCGGVEMSSADMDAGKAGVRGGTGTVSGRLPDGYTYGHYRRGVE